MRKIFVVALSELAGGARRVVYVNERPVIVGRVNDDFYAIDGICPHKGGPLYDGTMSDTVLTCPWHQWKWDVRTGRGVTNADIQVRSYPTLVEDGRLFVVVETGEVG